MGFVLSAVLATALALTPPALDYKPVSLAIVFSLQTPNRPILMLPWPKNFHSIKECETVLPIVVQQMMYDKEPVDIILATCHIPDSIDI